MSKASAGWLSMAKMKYQRRNNRNERMANNDAIISLSNERRQHHQLMAISNIIEAYVALGNQLERNILFFNTISASNRISGIFESNGSS
jgi:hypothetical protein